MRLHSTHEQLVQVPEVLAGFFSSAQADENAEIKVPLK